MNKKSTDTLTDWSEYKTTLDLTKNEWDEINLKVKIADKLIKARESRTATQESFEELGNVRQSAIAQ